MMLRLFIVHLTSFAVLTSAPSLSSRRTSSTCPFLAALWMGVSVSCMHARHGRPHMTCQQQG